MEIRLTYLESLHNAKHNGCGIHILRHLKEGYLNSVEWNGELEWWNGMDWNGISFH